MEKWDICIIGAGASGMAAAIAAAGADPTLRILVLEKKEEPGKKLRATGNGRCNITNAACKFAPQVLFFLENIGIVTKEEAQGRIYPYSGQASEVVEAFKRSLELLNVEIRCGNTVLSVEKKETFVLEIQNSGRIMADKVIIACGGKAGPQFGTTGDGYSWARNFGHTVNRLSPVLTPVQLAYPKGSSEAESLKGIRADGSVSLYRDGIEIAKEQGEIQFTGKGISGVCVLNLSRFIKLESGETVEEGLKRYEISIDFMPEYSESMVKEVLLSRRRIKGFCAIDLFRTIVDERIGRRILRDNGIEPDTEAASLGESIIGQLAAYIKAFKAAVAGAGGWKEAQCTSGGISLTEIDENTMESKLTKGLYFTGEILDYDGPCGGYNLQNAWETGIKAGMAAGR